MSDLNPAKSRDEKKSFSTSILKSECQNSRIQMATSWLRIRPNHSVDVSVLFWYRSRYFRATDAEPSLLSQLSDMWMPSGVHTQTLHARRAQQMHDGP